MDRRTRQRDAIEDAIQDASGPLMPQQILEVARRVVPALNLSTVYRTLGRMIEDGDIVEVSLPGEPARFESCEAAKSHHHHFRCTTCTNVYDVQGCVPGLSKLLPKGFKLATHDITLYGTCVHCAE